MSTETWQPPSGDPIQTKPEKRRWNVWDVVLWLFAWPWALMRLIGRHARWSPTASNLAGVGATVAFIAIIAAAAGGGSTTSDSASAADPQVTQTQAATGAQSSAPKSNGAQHVGYGDSLRVDALTWNVESVATAKTLGDQDYGLGETADGTFVIVKLHVHSDRDESADLASGGSHDLVELSGGGTTTKASTEGMTAYELEGSGSAKTLAMLPSIAPDADKTVVVVFDVPDSRLDDDLDLRFGELGFGSGHGFIHLPGSKL